MNLVVLRKKLLNLGLFNVLKASSVISSILIVVGSYKLFPLKIYFDIQSDYALYLFAVLIFNFGMNPVAQILGNHKNSLINEFKLVVVFLIIILFALNFFLPKNFLLNFIGFNQNNSSLVYGWPLLVVQNIISFYFLGRKKYFLHFSIPSINNLLILVGLFLYLNSNDYNLIFLPSLIFSLIIIICCFLSINYLQLKSTHLTEILRLWKINILPVLSSFTGVKNINYFIVTFVGKEFFGVFKLILTFFNFLNFFIATEITIFTNNSLSEGKNILLSLNKVHNLKKIIVLLNIIFCLILFIINNSFYHFFDFDFSLIISFTIINVFNLFYILDNSVMFVAEKNNLRVYTDIVSFFLIILTFLFIFRQFSFSNLGVMYLLILIYLVNLLCSTYFYYFKK